ncbi:MAG: VWA domain-containing protein [Terriglobales bacterium]
MFLKRAASCGSNYVSMSLGSLLCSAVACLAIVPFGFAQAVLAPAELTLKASASEVRVTFTTDRNGRILSTVQPGDFAVVDQDRVVRDFRSFTRSEYTRLDVAVLVDMSGSITPKFRQKLSSIVDQFAHDEALPGNSLSVISFRGLKPTLLCDRNCRDLNFSAHFPAAGSADQTPLHDSIVFASQLLARRSDPQTRKIVILFSDGADTISLHSFTDTLDTAIDEEVAIYSVDSGDSSHPSSGSPVLRTLAAGTGGRYFPLDAGPAKILDAVLADSRTTYTVAYKLPSPAAGFHLVRVLPTHDLDLQFHCRRGYYYPGDSGN